MRVIRSSSALLTSESVPRPMSLGLPRIASLRGVKKPFATERMVDACHSFLTSICNFFKGTVFCRSMTQVSLMYLEALAGRRCTVHLTPSNMNPSPSW